MVNNNNHILLQLHYNCRIGHPDPGFTFIWILQDWFKGRRLWSLLTRTQSGLRHFLHTSSTVIKFARTLFLQFGLPDVIVTDNGPCFMSEEFDTFLVNNGIKHITSAPYHPATNRLEERAVQIVKKGLKKETAGTTETRLAKILMAYWTTPQSTTGVTPAELLQGRRSRTRLDILKPNLCQRVERQQSHQKSGHDSIRSRVFSEGERVYARGLGLDLSGYQQLLRKSLDPFHIWSDLMTIDWWDAIKTIWEREQLAIQLKFLIAKGRTIRQMRIMRSMSLLMSPPDQAKMLQIRLSICQTNHLTHQTLILNLMVAPRLVKPLDRVLPTVLIIQGVHLHSKCLERLTLWDYLNIQTITETFNETDW